jgi:hypothetical protein
MDIEIPDTDGSKVRDLFRYLAAVFPRGSDDGRERLVAMSSFEASLQYHIDGLRKNQRVLS